jgi:hypothetical protein
MNNANAEIRIIAGPTWFAGPRKWEVTVSFPAYSAKTARAVYKSMPDSFEHDGKTYHKAGFRVSDSKAWYRTQPEAL